MRKLLGTLAALVALVFVCLALARFVRLRLLPAGDRPRELLFGALRDKGFWVRMAAATGLPSSSRQLGALSKPAFWALFLARFVVYTGGVLARAWVLIGALVSTRRLPPACSRSAFDAIKEGRCDYTSKRPKRSEGRQSVSQRGDRKLLNQKEVKIKFLHARVPAAQHGRPRKGAPSEDRCRAFGFYGAPR